MTNRSITGRTTTILTAVLAALALVLSACAADDDGEVTMARADWESGHMQAAIYAQLIEELGHQVSDPAEKTRDPNGFYPALATGQFDLWVNGWFPLHDIYLEGTLVTGQTTDLIGCNEGWGCNGVIDSHIAELSWGDNVEQVSGDYNDPVRGVRDRVAAGEPALFYAWTPNWTYEILTPGTDVVWLESPALEDEEGSTEVRGLRGCASDPCKLGWAVSSIRAVGNEDFLDDNPDIRRLLDVVSIPLSDIAAQNAKMATAELGYSEAEIRADAAAWIELNRDTVDGWLATARG